MNGFARCRSGSTGVSSTLQRSFRTAAHHVEGATASRKAVSVGDATTAQALKVSASDCSPEITVVAAAASSSKAAIRNPRSRCGSGPKVSVKARQIAERATAQVVKGQRPFDTAKRVRGPHLYTPTHVRPEHASVLPISGHASPELGRAPAWGPAIFVR